MVIRNILLALLSLYCAPSFARGNDTSSGSRRPDAPLVTKNIISFTPIQLVENSYGFGVAFEHFTGKNGILSICLPVFSTYDITNGHNPRRNQTTYIMPGVKLYVSKPGSKIKCALGPSIIAGIGQSIVYNDFGVNPTGPQQKSVLGTVVNGSVNIYPFPHIYYGVELGGGYLFYERVGARDYGSQRLVHCGFSIGYRF